MKATRRDLSDWRRSNCPRAEILESRLLLDVGFRDQFSHELAFGATFVASRQGDAATIELIRYNGGGLTTPAEQVLFETKDGTAQAGVDYTPVRQVVTLSGDRSVSSVKIPLLAPSLGRGDRTVALTATPLDPRPHGPPVQTAVLTIVDRTDIIPPSLSDTTFRARGRSIRGVVLSFNEAMDPTSVADPAAYRITRAGIHDHVGFDDIPVRGRPIPLTSANYDPVGRSVTLTPRRPLKAGVIYLVSAIRPLKDQAGNLLRNIDSSPDPEAAGRVSLLVSRGRRLKFATALGLSASDNVTASVQLTGPGMLESVEGPYAPGVSRSFYRLRVVGADPLRTVLRGTVRDRRGPVPGTSINNLVNVASLESVHRLVGAFDRP